MIPSIYIKSHHHLFLGLYSYASESVCDPPNLPLALAYTHMLWNRQQGHIYLCLSASSSEDASRAYFQMTYYYILKEIIKLYKGECECADIGVEDLVQSTVTITSQKFAGCFKWWLLMVPYLATSSHWPWLKLSSLFPQLAHLSAVPVLTSMLSSLIVFLSLHLLKLHCHPDLLIAIVTHSLWQSEGWPVWLFVRTIDVSLIHVILWGNP